MYYGDEEKDVREERNCNSQQSGKWVQMRVTQKQSIYNGNSVRARATVWWCEVEDNDDGNGERMRIWHGDEDNDVIIILLVMKPGFEVQCEHQWNNKFIDAYLKVFTFQCGDVLIFFSYQRHPLFHQVHPGHAFCSWPLHFYCLGLGCLALQVLGHWKWCHHWYWSELTHFPWIKVGCDVGVRTLMHHWWELLRVDSKWDDVASPAMEYGQIDQ